MNHVATIILLVVKIVFTAFFTFVFFGNLATFFRRGKPDSFDIYLESQIWLLISLLAIAFIWRVLP